MVDRPLADVLIEAVRTPNTPAEQAGRLLTAAASQLDELAAAAEHHRISPAVYRLVRPTETCPPKVVDSLAGSYHQQVTRHLITSADLAVAGQALSGSGITWLVMKGPVLSDRLWPSPDMREYFDLDIVVARPQFGDAIAALEAAGATLVDRNWPLINWQRRAELTLLLPNGTGLDLHWDLVNDYRTRQHLAVPTADMMTRACRVSLGQMSVPTFDAADTLLSLAVHAALSGANRLMWLRDVELALSVAELDLDEFTERAERSRLSLICQIVLAKVHRTLGTETPSSISRAPWQLVTGIADRRWPAPRLPSERRSGQLLYRSTRSNSAQSLRAAVGSVVHPPRGTAVEGQPGNPLHADRPDRRAREEYFDAVHNRAKP